MRKKNFWKAIEWKRSWCTILPGGSTHFQLLSKLLKEAQGYWQSYSLEGNFPMDVKKLNFDIGKRYLYSSALESFPPSPNLFWAWACLLISTHNWSNVTISEWLDESDVSSWGGISPTMFLNELSGTISIWNRIFSTPDPYPAGKDWR